MDADDPVGAGPAELTGDDRAPVAALGAVPLVAEASHQLGERGGDPAELPAGLSRRPGEPEAGDARQHQVERVGGVAAVRARVGQRADDPVNSTIEPGQPCVMISGVASGSGDRMCAKWMFAPSIVGGELRPLVQLALPPPASRTRAASTGRAPGGSRAGRRTPSPPLAVRPATGCGQDGRADRPGRSAGCRCGRGGCSFSSGSLRDMREKSFHQPESRAPGGTLTERHKTSTSTPTPHANARRTARRLGNAVLLTHDGFGHISFVDPSACVVGAIGDYLVHLTTPPPGTESAPPTGFRSTRGSASRSHETPPVGVRGGARRRAGVARGCPGRGRSARAWVLVVRLLALVVIVLLAIFALDVVLDAPGGGRARAARRVQHRGVMPRTDPRYVMMPRA